MKKFCKVALIYGLIMTAIISLLLIGLGILMILNSELVLQIIIGGLSGICILFGTAGIFSMLICTFMCLTR